MAIFLAVSVVAPLRGQSAEIDSLLAILPVAPDTIKVNIQNKLSLRFINSSPKKASEYVEQALELAKNINYPQGTADSYIIIGNFHQLHGNFPEALDHYLKALDMYQGLKSKRGEAVALLNIGAIYQAKFDFKRSIAYYEKALAIEEKTNNPEGIANCLNNLGNTYAQQEQYDQAIACYEKALGIYEKFQKFQGISNCFNNIANVYDIQGQPQKAIEYYQKALGLLEEIGDKAGIAVCLHNIAFMHDQLSEPQQVIRYALQSLEIAQEIGAKDDIKNAAKTLANTYAQIGNYAKAFEYQSLYLGLEREINGEETARIIARFQASYDLKQKEAEIALLEKNNELKETKIALLEKDNRFNRLVLYAVMGGLALVMIIMALLYRANRQKFIANRQLQAQKSEIEQKNQMLEANERTLRFTNQALEQKGQELEAVNQQIAEKNKNITASINYAQRIQEALLPLEAEMKVVFPDLFIFYHPRDIVSGDFYWFTEQEGQYWLAVADCTGHGVPGAFMSMIGHAFLKQIIQVQKITEPGQVLNELSEQVRKALHQDLGGSKDGMEMVICKIDPHTKTIHSAGAVSTMLLVDAQNLLLIPGDRQSIGGGYDFREERHQFISRAHTCTQPTMLYLFSDGFQDQFGGERGRKFGKNRFYELLQKIHHEPIERQKRMLDQAFTNWQKDNRQIDDVLVLGLKLS
ncbi:MAG: hypothetical protein OHK0053_23290 [Microscillaceae bacterium]